MEGNEATRRQLRYIANLTEDLGKEKRDRLLALAGVAGVEELTREQASALIRVSRMLPNSNNKKVPGREKELGNLLRKGWEIADASLPKEAGVDVKADIAARLGITLFLDKKRRR